MTTAANPIKTDETGALSSYAAMRLHDLRATDAATIRVIRDRTARGQDVTREEIQAARTALQRDEARVAGGLTAAVSTLPAAPRRPHYSSTYEETARGDDTGHVASVKPASALERGLYALECELEALGRALR